MAQSSATGLLTLHAVRLKGFADTAAVAARFGLDTDRTREDLLDAQAYGLVSRTSFADLTGWSLTGAGYRHNQAQLRDELDRVDGHRVVTAAHDRFLPLNARASELFTAWQLGSGGELSPLARLADDLRDLEEVLAALLGRFAGYHGRFGAALARAGHDAAWITGIEVDSCHRVWFELHEDLIATLGITRQ
jgi:hypothetical protein